MKTITEHILKVVLSDNPWLEGEQFDQWYHRYIPEHFIPRSLKLEADNRVCLVVGPRQAGKTTLIWKTISQTGKPCLYLNCEEYAIRDWLSSPASFIADIKDLITPDTIIFFDEIQHLKEAGLFLKGLVDRRTKHTLFATGSSTFDLESKTRESLAGRALRYLLLPLSFEELSCNIKQNKPALASIKRTTLVNRQIIFGGYPPVCTSSKPEKELTALVESFVIRDASDRMKIKYPSAFRKIMELSASQIGNLCNYSEWAAIAGISNDTVREYVGILEDSHVIRLIRPYIGGKRAEITSTPKLYYLDNGIRNQVFAGFSAIETRPDRGALLENFVFTEISKSINVLLDNIKFWRSKSGAEVDFLLERKGQITAYEVKAGDSRGKITRSSRSFIDAYQPEYFYIVTEKTYPEQKLGKTKIQFIQPTEVSISVSHKS